MTEREHLAAEYALGLLEGSELLEARGLVATDPAFASQVAYWEGALAPLLDDIPEAAPPSELWPRIEGALAARGPGAEIIALQRRLRHWQIGAGLAAVAAIVLALISLPLRSPAPTARPAPLVASLELSPATPRVGVTWLPDRRELLVSAPGVSGVIAHDRELWIVPAQGQPRSLGVIKPGADRRLAIDATLAALLGDGTTLALSVEPAGGSPTGLPTGPVIATGTLQKT